MINWYNPRYSSEELKIISDAVQFGKDSLRNYYSRKFAGANRVTWEIIDGRRGENDQELNNLLQFITNDKRSTFLRSDEKIHFSQLGSVLNLYLLFLDDEITMFDEPELLSKRDNVKKMLTADIFKELNTHSYDEFYFKEKKTIPNLLFFSYSTKDKEIVGKISDILVSKYGFSIFRAHDKIKINENWRKKIKENLEACEGLITYVTRRFLFSHWVHQECGWIMARDKPIYSLFVAKKRPGFLEERQGKNIRDPPDPAYVAGLINDYFKNLGSRASSSNVPSAYFEAIDYMINTSGQLSQDIDGIVKHIKVLIEEASKPVPTKVNAIISWKYVRRKAPRVVVEMLKKHVELLID